MIHTRKNMPERQREKAIALRLAWESGDPENRVLICVSANRREEPNLKAWEVYDSAIGQGKDVRVVYANGEVEIPQMLPFSD